MARPLDVVVIGAGPAGSTTARLLAMWGHSVALWKGPVSRNVFAESLPPSIDNIFEVLGIRTEIATAGFYPDRGNTSWWGTADARIETYGGDRSGYHVDRPRFDELLVDLAQQAGAVVQRTPRAGVALSNCDARFVVDATGRAGVLARRVHRRPDTRYRTIALSAVLRAASGWSIEPHHTLIEAYDRGWAWSVPLSGDRRYVSFMVDALSVHGGIEHAYRAELERTVHFSSVFEPCEFEAPPAGRDASLYHARRYAGPNWILAGDAGSFVDPLSSFGVKKAMVSAWTAAVVVNTCLSNPPMANAAIQLFNARESEAWLDHARRAELYFGEAARVFDTPFWRDRAKPAETVLYRNEELQSALDRLRRTEPVRFLLSDQVRYAEKAVIRGREVVMATRAVLPGLPNTEYMQGVHLTTVAELARSHSSIGPFYENYVEQRGETPLSNFLAALSLLVAKDVLQIRG